MGVYGQLDNDDSFVDMGCRDGVPIYCEIWIRAAASLTFHQYQQSIVAVPTVNAVGLFSFTFDGANLRIYKNGILIDTTAAPFVANPNNSIWLMASNPIGFYTTKRNSLFYFCKFLTTSEMATFYTIIKTYQEDLGRAS